jgi:Porin PorA
MRRVAGLVLSALGTFLIVLALLTRFVVVDEAVKYPLNEDTVVTLVANHASYFSPSHLSELTGTLNDTLTTQGDAGAGNSSTAVWTQFSYVYDRTNDQTVSYSTEKLAFDRRTAQIENCCGTAIGTNTKVHVSGLGFLWPFNAQKTTYQVFNTTLLKTVPAVYSGTATVMGVKTYKYVENVPATQDGSQTVPGTLVGLKSSASVTLPEYYTSSTTEYVDPITGAPVKGVSAQHIYLQNSSGAPVLTLINANFVTTPASVATVVQTVKTDDSEIDTVSFILPLVFGIVGVILLAMGLILYLTQREDAMYEDEDEEEPEVGEVSV